MSKATPSRIIIRCMSLMMLALLPSCETAKFYTQALGGQMEMLHAARPIVDVKKDASTKPGLRRKLALVEELRSFAKTELHLPVKKQYSTYADLHRKFALWAVYAAPEFSVEAKTWWYPLVGTLKYRGYFSEQLAKDEVKQLKKEGYDVFGSGVPAYSTLGWFSDPVLSTFIDRDDVELAELIFHELTHPRVFFPGDTDFNEAFATANSEEGVRRWLRAKGDLKALASYERSLKQNDAVLRLILRTRDRLEEVYAKKDSMSLEDMRKAKAALIVRLRQEYVALKKSGRSDSSYDRWFASKPINNARLCAVASYHDLVPGFHRLLKEQGGDLEKFYEAAEKLKPLSKEERRRRLGVCSSR